jgi:GntR family transcriptional regulator of arabinose operon
MDIADKFEVSRTTVRLALSHLVNEGVVYRIPGKGTFITDPHKNGHKDKNRFNKTVGLVFMNVRGNFMGEIIHGIESVLTEKGYTMEIYVSNDDFGKESDNLKKLIDKNVSGVVLFMNSGNDRVNPNIPVYLEFDRNHIPLVFVDRYLEEIDTDYVVTNDFEISCQATQYLIDKGHKKIGYITPQEKTSTIKQRLEGYKKTLIDNRVMIDPGMILVLPPVIQNPNTTEAGYSVLKTYLSGLRQDSDVPTAFIAASNSIGAGMKRAISEVKPELVGKIQILMFGHITEFGVNSTSYPIIYHPAFELGVKSAELVVNKIEGGIPVNEHKHLVVESKLLIQNSVPEQGEIKESSHV